MNDTINMGEDRIETLAYMLCYYIYIRQKAIQPRAIPFRIYEVSPAAECKSDELISPRTADIPLLLFRVLPGQIHRYVGGVGGQWLRPK